MRILLQAVSIADSIKNHSVCDSLCQIVNNQVTDNIVDEVPVAFEMINNLGIWSSLIGVGIAFVLCIISFALTRIRIGSGFLKISFIFAWLFSFAVYDVGMCINFNYWTLLSNAPMAMLHAFGSFLLSSDVSEVHTRFFENPLYMALFSASHAFSAFVCALFIIKIFGFNLMQRIRLFFEAENPICKKDTYVFWGCNSASYKLIESINEHYGNDKNDYRIIIVKTSNETDNASDNEVGINYIFDILSINHSELEQLQNLGCFILTSAHCRLSDLSCFSECKDNIFNDILNKELKLKSLVKLINKKKTSGSVHFLFLSDDEKQNLHDVSVLLNDTTLNSFVGYEASDASFDVQPHSDQKVIFYCHARYNGVHRVIEDLHCSKKLEVRVIDSSHMNVELLKSNPEVLPVNFVSVEPDATVSSAFNAMVIGFSEVGQDATRFLYEFGAFVKSGANDNYAERSEFHLDVIDNHMKDKAGIFVANAPAISVSVPFVKDKENENALITLHDIDCCSVEFYDMLKNKIETLNYVVVATDDDELNISTGIRIFRFATRYRHDMEHLCILIRIHNDDDGHFSKIAQYYNRLWASQDMEDVVGKYPSTLFKKSDTCNLPLYIFGQDEDVYTYRNIIDNSVIQEAVKFKEFYAASTEDDYNSEDSEHIKIWYKEIEELLQNNSDYHTSYARLMKLRRTHGQDMANSQHRLTKELLRDKAVDKNDIVNYSWSSLHRPHLKTVYCQSSASKADSQIFSILRVLAQTEHIRWNASHEILGYVFDQDGKNEIKLHHNCITGWDALDEETRSYDYNVVDLTFGIDRNH